MRDLHGWAAVVCLRHLPWFDVPVCVERRPTRSRGPYGAGHPTTTPRCAWDESRRPTTTAYEPWALRLVSNATVAAAARQLGVAAETSDGILDRWLERAVDWTAGERLGVIGLDEMARTRGPRDGSALVTVPLAGGGVEILAVLADRTQETVAALLRAIPEPRRHTLERACTAMSEGLVRASEAEGPWAEIGIDRFPVARASRAGADTGRQHARKRLKRARPQAECAARQGALWPLRQRPVERKPPAWERLARVFTSAPTLDAADHLREDLTALFERDDTKAGATCAMRAWGTRVRARGLAACESVLGTSDRWMDTITNDCQGRQTRGVVEGFNTRVNVLKRRCDGIFNVGRLFQRLTRDRQGDQRFSHT